MSKIWIFFSPCRHCGCTSASLTLIILFSETLIFLIKKYFSEIYFLKENKESDKTFGNFSSVEMESSELINYLTNMCQSGQCTTIVSFLVFWEFSFT
jgi:hypothetical protein